MAMLEHEKKRKEQGIKTQKELAREDRKTLKAKGIKSRDLTTMIRYRHGKSTFFCNSIEQLEKLKKKIEKGGFNCL